MPILLWRLLQPQLRYTEKHPESLATHTQEVYLTLSRTAVINPLQQTLLVHVLDAATARTGIVERRVIFPGHWTDSTHILLITSIPPPSTAAIIIIFHRFPFSTAAAASSTPCKLPTLIPSSLSIPVLPNTLQHRVSNPPANKQPPPKRLRNTKPQRSPTSTQTSHTHIPTISDFSSSRDEPKDPLLSSQYQHRDTRFFLKDFAMRFPTSLSSKNT